MPALKNKKHEAYCQAFVRGDTAGNMAASYAKVYGKDASASHVRSAASRLNQHPNVLNRVAELQAQLDSIHHKATERALEKYEVTAERVVSELARIAFSNMLDYVQPTAEGDVVVDLSALNRDQASAISEVVVDTYQDGRGDDAKEVKRVRFKLADKRAALVDLGKHMGLFVDRRKPESPYDGMDEADIDSRISELERQLGVEPGAKAKAGKAQAPTGQGPGSKPH